MGSGVIMDQGPKLQGAQKADQLNQKPKVI